MPSSRWFGADAGLIIPAGVILGFDGGAVPDNFTAFTDADGKVLLGTTTTDVTDIGGSNTVHGGSVSGGNHGNSVGQYVRDYGDTGSGGSERNPSNDASSKGNHSHSISTRYYPKTDNIKLIKATAGNRGLPAGAIVFGMEAVTGLDLFATFNDNQGILEANTTIGVTAASKSQSLGNASYSHQHEVAELHTAGGVQDPTYSSVAAAGPSHGHSWNAAVTYNKKVVLLRALKAAAKVARVTESFIALFDGTTVPDGWVLCDGNNGTPNMSDRYVQSVATGDGSTSGSAHSASCSAGTGSSSHAHSFSGFATGSAICTNGHHSNSVNHNHTAGGTNNSFYPPWFKMKFIMLET